MPKSIIREIDNSTSSVSLSSNFAVFVPGYADSAVYTDPANLASVTDEEKTAFKAAIEEVKNAGILIDEVAKIYKLTSRSDFEKYIGKFGGVAKKAQAPTLEKINISVSDLENPGAYKAKLKYSDFYNLSENELCYYRGITVNTSEVLNGRLLKTFEYKVLDTAAVEAIPAEAVELESGNTGTSGTTYYTRELSSAGAGYRNDGTYAYTPYENAIVSNEGNTYFSLTTEGTDAVDATYISHVDTYKFTKVSKAELIDALEEITVGDDGKIINSSETDEEFFLIKSGNEGWDEYKTEDLHHGNQIAWELLGLGYTVYYRVLSQDNSVENQLSKEDFWSVLKNKSTYRIRYITSGGFTNSTVAQYMTNLAAFYNDEEAPTVEDTDIYGSKFNTGRGDCFALLDIDEDTDFNSNDNIPSVKNATTALQLNQAVGLAAKQLPASKYAAIFCPKVTYIMSDSEVKDYGGNKTFPASFHYLACAAEAQSRYAEWYAVAGYSRGVANRAIAYTSRIFGDIDVNTLAPRVPNIYTDRAVNLILCERGNYYLWGNRTSALIDKTKGLTFSHFLNIRQLCCTIKQVLFEATRRFTFDPNSDLLWVNFVNSIRPTLENMKADQGIAGYMISKVATDKKALLKARIRIVPIEAVEDFDISIYLEDSVSGIVVSAEETEAE